ncbi:hematopoietic prostaglandin D synthase-like [Watersipora subatra]|uniref:hematopoietic prostaglandin D synthase-like n=1 Tax=Watersipora subatra TaxID=2589382 RepID=UPI00355AF8E2
MAPPKCSFTYFNGRGRGEQIRWLFVQAGAEWEDRRIEQDAWPELKPKAPTGALPFIEVAGKAIGQSGAVAMYVARENGLLGSSNLEAAQIHMLWECTQDALNAMFKAMFCKDSDKQAAMFNDYYTQSLPKLIKLMAAHLKGGRDWLIGNKVSMADLVTVCLLENYTDGPGLAAIEAEPSVKALIERVKNLPNIKKWIATRPASQF